MIIEREPLYTSEEVNQPQRLLVDREDQSDDTKCMQIKSFNLKQFFYYPTKYKVDIPQTYEILHYI